MKSENHRKPNYNNSVWLIGRNSLLTMMPERQSQRRARVVDPVLEITVLVLKCFKPHVVFYLFISALIYSQYQQWIHIQVACIFHHAVLLGQSRLYSHNSLFVPYAMDYNRILQTRTANIDKWKRHHDWNYQYDETGIDKRTNLSIQEFSDVYDGKWYVCYIYSHDPFRILLVFLTRFSFPRIISCFRWEVFRSMNT